VADITKMQDIVREEVDKGKILLRTEDEMATIALGTSRCVDTYAYREGE
jgi:hypothetical protein